jgi:hypothetical protein
MGLGINQHRWRKTHFTWFIQLQKEDHLKMSAALGR